MKVREAMLKVLEIVTAEPDRYAFQQISVPDLSVPSTSDEYTGCMLGLIFAVAGYPSGHGWGWASELALSAPDHVLYDRMDDTEIELRGLTSRKQAQWTEGPGIFLQVFPKFIDRFYPEGSEAANREINVPVEEVSSAPAP